MPKDNNSLELFNIFMNILKTLIYFDTTTINTMNNIDIIKKQYSGGALDGIAAKLVKNIPNLNKPEQDKPLIEDDEDTKDSMMKKVLEGISKVVKFLKSKIIPLLMFVLTASVYPAVPFFSVLAIMLGVLKYIFYKIRKI